MKASKKNPVPCRDCPWRRKSLRGWLGGKSPEFWLEAAHSDSRVNCHLGPGRTHSDTRGRHCAGVMIFRTNICKLPRDPSVPVAPHADTASVFAGDSEFTAHHDIGLNNPKRK